LSFLRKWESIFRVKNETVLSLHLASRKNGVLYIGITNDLRRRVYEHKKNLIAGFTKKYNVNKLVYFELINQPLDAINREKRMKKWKRQWKIELIERMNPGWKDLYFELT